MNNAASHPFFIALKAYFYISAKNWYEETLTILILSEESDAIHLLRCSVSYPAASCRTDF